MVWQARIIGLIRKTVKVSVGFTLFEWDRIGVLEVMFM